MVTSRRPAKDTPTPTATDAPKNGKSRKKLPKAAPEGGAHPAPQAEAPKPAEPPKPQSILVIDIGGTNLKILASGQTEPRRHASGTGFTPQQMVQIVRDLAGDWTYDAVSIG